MISQASGSVHCHQKILSCSGNADVKALDIVTQIFTVPFLCRIHNGDRIKLKPLAAGQRHDAEVIILRGPVLFIIAGDNHLVWDLAGFKPWREHA